VAFVAVVQGKVGLWLRPLEAANPRLVPGSDGAARPFWSPDSGSVAFFAGGALQRLDLSRQTISKICDVDRVYWGGSWSSDGRILFAIRDVGIFQVPASGGAATQVTILDREHGEVNHVLPQVLPGGRFLYSVMSPTPGVYAASLDKPAERIRLVANAGEARYAPGAGGTDYLLWIRDRALMARRFDADKLQLLGEPHQLADPVAIASSGGDVLLYGSSVSLRKFKWLDRRGNDAGSLGEPGPWVFNRISHDGRRVVTVRAGNPSDLWLLETGRGVASRLTSGPGSHISPVWSPDGRTILYSTGSPFNLFRISSDGAGGEERLTQSPRAQRAQDWSRDGRLLLFAEDGLDTGIDLWVLPVTPEGRPAQGAKPRLYLGVRFDQSLGSFSPDGHWVAYQSNESGQSEVYVRSFPEGTDKICLSKGGGIYPEWGPGGRELYYQSPDGKLMLVTLKTTSSSLEAQLPHELFALPNSYSVPGGYEAASDGQRFLVGDVVASPEPLTVIVNWRALLRKGR
jgi:Tol biopolymer transport system component